MKYVHQCDDAALTVCEQELSLEVGIWIGDGPAAFIKREDAPRVALEILKAAGYCTKGEYVLANAINAAVACLENHIEQQAKAKEAEFLAKRRDELANEFAPRDIALKSNWYGNVSPGLQSAIDRIIEMESRP